MAVVEHLEGGRRPCGRRPPSAPRRRGARSARAHGVGTSGASVQHTLCRPGRITAGRMAARRSTSATERSDGPQRTRSPLRAGRRRRARRLLGVARLLLRRRASGPATRPRLRRPRRHPARQRLAQRHLPGQRARSPSRSRLGRPRPVALALGAFYLVLGDLGPASRPSAASARSSTRSRSATATTSCTWSLGILGLLASPPTAASGPRPKRGREGRVPARGSRSGRSGLRSSSRAGGARHDERRAQAVAAAATPDLDQRRAPVPATPPTAAAAIGRTQLRGSRSD